MLSVITWCLPNGYRDKTEYLIFLKKETDTLFTLTTLRNNNWIAWSEKTASWKTIPGRRIYPIWYTIHRKITEKKTGNYANYRASKIVNPTTVTAPTYVSTISLPGCIPDWSGETWVLLWWISVTTVNNWSFRRQLRTITNSHTVNNRFTCWIWQPRRLIHSGKTGFSVFSAPSLPTTNNCW